MSESSINDVQLLEVIAGFWVDFIFRVVKRDLMEAIKAEKNKDHNLYHTELIIRFDEFNNHLRNYDKNNKLANSILESLYSYMKNIHFVLGTVEYNKCIVQCAKLFFPPTKYKKLNDKLAKQILIHSMFQINQKVISDLQSSPFWKGIYFCDKVNGLAKLGPIFTDSYVRMSYAVIAVSIYMLDPPNKPGGTLAVTSDLAKKLKTTTKNYKELAEKYNMLVDEYESLKKTHDELLQTYKTITSKHRNESASRLKHNKINTNKNKKKVESSSESDEESDDENEEESDNENNEESDEEHSNNTNNDNESSFNFMSNDNTMPRSSVSFNLTNKSNDDDSESDSDDKVQVNTINNISQFNMPNIQQTQTNMDDSIESAKRLIEMRKTKQQISQTPQVNTKGTIPALNPIMAQYLNNTK